MTGTTKVNRNKSLWILKTRPVSVVIQISGTRNMDDKGDEGRKSVRLRMRSRLSRVTTRDSSSGGSSRGRYESIRGDD